VRPWLTAIALVPIAMALPWLARELSGALDRLWFGRRFTAFGAVKHLLGAMQSASGEAALVQEAERRIGEVVNAGVEVRLDDEPSANGGVEVEGSTPSGGRIRVAVQPAPDARRLLSEDLQMLRSLAGVLGLMLETLRLQHKR